MLLQLARATAAHAEERNSLKEKAERLQKATKQRRQELAEMQEKSSALHQRASAYDQVHDARRGFLNCRRPQLHPRLLDNNRLFRVLA